MSTTTTLSVAAEPAYGDIDRHAQALLWRSRVEETVRTVIAKDEPIFEGKTHRLVDVLRYVGIDFDQFVDEVLHSLGPDGDLNGAFPDGDVTLTDPDEHKNVHSYLWGRIVIVAGRLYKEKAAHMATVRISDAEREQARTEYGSKTPHTTGVDEGVAVLPKSERYTKDDAAYWRTGRTDQEIDAAIARAEEADARAEAEAAKLAERKSGGDPHAYLPPVVLFDAETGEYRHHAKKSEGPLRTYFAELHEARMHDYEKAADEFDRVRRRDVKLSDDARIDAVRMYQDSIGRPEEARVRRWLIANLGGMQLPDRHIKLDHVDDTDRLDDRFEDERERCRVVGFDYTLEDLLDADVIVFTEDDWSDPNSDETPVENPLDALYPLGRMPWEIGYRRLICGPNIGTDRGVKAHSAAVKALVAKGRNNIEAFERWGYCPECMDHKWPIKECSECGEPFRTGHKNRTKCYGCKPMKGTGK